MDRLPTLIALVALAGCEKGKDEPAPSDDRVNAAKVATKKTDVAAFCDKTYPVETAPVFSTPELANGGALPASTQPWRWVNVWATWCKPCVDEIPRIVKFRGTTKTPFDLQLVSIDESEDDLAAYRKLHPETPPSVRLAKENAQAAWFAELGLDAAAPIPVHVFVDASNRVRCVRAGGVREADFAAVAALLAGR